MTVTIHLQNVLGEGCIANIRSALKMIDGVLAVQVNREELVANVLYESPATPVEMREQLLLGGYLLESR